jgi:hypothetical protein
MKLKNKARLLLLLIIIFVIAPFSLDLFFGYSIDIPIPLIAIFFISVVVVMRTLKCPHCGKNVFYKKNAIFHYTISWLNDYCRNCGKKYEETK